MTTFDDYRSVIASCEASISGLEMFVQGSLMDDETVVLTGIGKSYDVACLGASLLQSVSLTAMAIHAVDLLHGGLGVCGKRPVTSIFLSHSGETVETLAALRAMRWTNNLVITGNRASTLAATAEFVAVYYAPRDGSRHCTIPSVSLIGQMTFLNTIACLVADTLEPDELLASHPAGSLRRKYEEM